ncbi:O-antigen ligase family protein [Salmonella enterica subsp. enterica]|nr:O-antigen ligase family protein [Salmonella enterica subsp. enterica]
MLENNDNNQFVMTRSWAIAHLIGISMLSIFLPVKIYPIIFIITMFVMMLRVQLKVHSYYIFASLLLMLILLSSTYTYLDDDTMTAIVKSFLGISLLITSGVFTFNKKHSIETLKIIHTYIFVIIALCFIQILVLHVQSGWYSLTVSDSYTAGMIFNSDYAIFGGNDKNMFGAKIALFGMILYVLHKSIYSKGSMLCILLVVATGFLSMSRTPVAFFLAALSLYKISFSRGVLMKISSVFFVLIIFAIASPYIIEYLRISSINQGELSDGMSIRLLYWTAVMSNTDVIGMFGNGLLSAREFLPRFSVYYNGEPNVHNLYLNTYLDLGVIGITLYLLMLVSLFLFLRRLSKKLALVLIACAFIISCTLYTAYDIEMWCYLSLSTIIIRLISQVR